jgi:hypothetical protein
VGGAAAAGIVGSGVATLALLSEPSSRRSETPFGVRLSGVWLVDMMRVF